LQSPHSVANRFRQIEQGGLLAGGKRPVSARRFLSWPAFKAKQAAGEHSRRSQIAASISKFYVPMPLLKFGDEIQKNMLNLHGN
jgi:hypothetical protein